MDLRNCKNYFARMDCKKLFVRLALAAATLVAFFFIVRIISIYAVYTYALSMASSLFGFDAMLARGLAVAMTCISFVITPWLISFFLFGNKKKELAIFGSMIAGVICVGIYFSTENVFFDRHTGATAKYYIKTTGGFKFSSRPDIDPVFGVRYKPMTQEIISEYLAWQKAGSAPAMPNIITDEYFDQMTGEPKVWYYQMPNGKFNLYSMPGFDRTTGEKLKPVTKDMIHLLPKATLHDMSYFGNIDDFFHKIAQYGEFVNRHYGVYKEKNLDTFGGYARFISDTTPVLNKAISNSDIGFDVTSEKKAITEYCVRRDSSGDCLPRDEIGFFTVEKIIQSSRFTAVIVQINASLTFNSPWKSTVRIDCHSLIDGAGRGHHCFGTHLLDDPEFGDINPYTITLTHGISRKILFVFESVPNNYLRQGSLRIEILGDCDYQEAIVNFRT